MNDPLPPPPEYANVPRVGSNAPNGVDQLTLGLRGINLQSKTFVFFDFFY